MFFYALFIRLYGGAIRMAALFNAKARAWVEGRAGWENRLRLSLSEFQEPVIWMHCASAGEFEQGKPVLEALRLQYPAYRMLVTFFSPSGFDVGKKYKGADLVAYLPLDTRANAARFVSLVQPALVVFVKYDFWYRHLEAVHRLGAPLLLVSALFRPGQAFFKWYGGLYRRLLRFFTALFVQDDGSVTLLGGIGVNNAQAVGDTRFDRVAHITHHPAPLPLIEAFAAGGEPLLVAGSTWPEDEALLLQLPKTVRIIMAPHETDAAHIAQIRRQWGTEAILYSELQQADGLNPDARVLVIDNIGMLSRLYRYADITYIGGGFNKSGIHNTLEAAAWGKPVFFGPNYQKFREARGLIEAGAAASVSDAEQLAAAVASLLNDRARCVERGAAAARYVASNIGATSRILQFIQENRLLTRL